MKNIQLICSDIDGTLLNKDRELSEQTKLAVQNLPSIPFILISSRMPKGMRYLQQELGIANLPLIAYNGGLILDQSNVLYSTEIDSKIVQAIYHFCKKTSLHISLYHHDEWYVPQMDYWANREKNNTKVEPIVQSIDKTINQWSVENKGAHKIMAMGDEREMDTLATFLTLHFKDFVIGYRSKATYLEISPKQVTKKTAITTLIHSKYPTLHLENVLAFGDNFNDTEMLKHVGVGVAVANAVTEAKQSANYITLSNIENGVASFLNNHF